MTGKERMDYMKRKANEYYTLRARWKDCIQRGMVRYNYNIHTVVKLIKITNSVWKSLRLCDK